MFDIDIVTKQNRPDYFGTFNTKKNWKPINFPIINNHSIHSLINEEILYISIKKKGRKTWLFLLSSLYSIDVVMIWFLILIVNGQVVRVRIKNKINVQYENLFYTIVKCMFFVVVENIQMGKKINYPQNRIVKRTDKQTNRKKIWNKQIDDDDRECFCNFEC